MINIKKNIITFKKDVKKMFLKFYYITDRKSFCISIIYPKLWNYYYNMINIKKNIITFKKDVKKMFLKFYYIFVYCFIDHYFLFYLYYIFIFIPFYIIISTNYYFICYLIMMKFQYEIMSTVKCIF